jgi:hypothetical protein
VYSIVRQHLSNIHLMSGLSSRVDGFKNSNSIPEPITCGFDGSGRVLPASERVRVNNGLGWVGLDWRVRGLTRTHEHP